MNNIPGFVIDEDVLDWLDDFTPHQQRDMAEAINMYVQAHREELTIPNVFRDEDMAALSHGDLLKIYMKMVPDGNWGLVLSNVHLLGLILNHLKVIEYKLPAINSPLLAERTFEEPGRVNRIHQFRSHGEIADAVEDWLNGYRPIIMGDIGSDVRPDIQGMYLCVDEHKQIRYGSLFQNAADGWTFSEMYTTGKSTTWLEGPTVEEDDLPMSLLGNWVRVSRLQGPNVRATVKNDYMVSDEHLIYMFLRSLSPHVKAEIVAHFDGVFDKLLPSVDAIGRLTESDWRKAAEWCADDAKMTAGKTTWQEHTARECFVATMDAFDFNFDLRQFNPQYDYQANDDSVEPDDE